MKVPKLNIKKLREVAVWGAIIVYLVISMSFVTGERKQVKCTEIKVEITDTTRNLFVEKEDILNLVNDKGRKLIGASLDSINTSFLEDLLYRHPSIKKAEVYRLVNGALEIDIEQRNPIVRIINDSGSCYIDEAGYLMPLSAKYTAHVLVVNGEISELAMQKYRGSVLLDTASIQPEKRFVGKLFEMIRYIFNDKLWHSQIEQIYVDRNKELELIPRVGDQVILFGDPDNYKEKLDKLEAIYRIGFNNLGWNIYKSINLKYSNQVVCTKK